MSWNRVNWERKHSSRASVPRTPLAPYSTSLREVYAAPYPLVRKLDTAQTPGITSLIAKALEAVRGHDGSQALLRGVNTHGPAVTLLSVRDMRSYGLRHLPRDKDTFLKELATTSGTSSQRLTGTGLTCGFFGRRTSGAVHVGVSFDETVSEVMVHEREAAAGIIWPELPNPRPYGHPHATLGQVVLAEAEKRPFKLEMNELLRELGGAILQPVSPSRE